MPVTGKIWNLTWLTSLAAGDQAEYMKNLFSFFFASLCSPFFSFLLLFHFGKAFYKFTWSSLTDCIFVLVEDRQPHYSIHRGSLTDRCIFHVPTCTRVSVCVCECGCVCMCVCMYAFVCDDFLLFPYYIFSHPPTHPFFSPPPSPAYPLPPTLPPLCVCVYVCVLFFLSLFPPALKAALHHPPPHLVLIFAIRALAASD